MGFAVFFIPRREVTTVIAEENEDRVLSKSFFFEHLPNTSDGVVDRFNTAVIIRQLCLPDARLLTQIFWHGFIQISCGRVSTENWLSASGKGNGRLTLAM